MEYEARVTAITVTGKGEPIYSESATTVRIDDEEAGEFLVISQSPDSGTKEIRINPEEWPTLRDAIDKMHTYCR